MYERSLKSDERRNNVVVINILLLLEMVGPLIIDCTEHYGHYVIETEGGARNAGKSIRNNVVISLYALFEARHYRYT